MAYKNLLVAVITCHRDRYNKRNDAVRKTWMNRKIGILNASGDHEYNGIKLDVKLVMGRAGIQYKQESDELYFDELPDDYANLSRKTQRIATHVLGSGHDAVFICFVDTYVMLDRLVATEHWRKDYVGFCGGVPKLYNYASGGAGYWLSRKSCSRLAAAQLPHEWAEDRWTGTVLSDAGIPIEFSHVYRPKYDDITKQNDLVSIHLSKGTDQYDPQWMYDLHYRTMDNLKS